MHQRLLSSPAAGLHAGSAGFTKQHRVCSLSSLRPAGSGQLVMDACLDAVFDAQSQRGADELVGLLAHLVTEGALPAADFLSGLSSNAESLEDLRCAMLEAEP